MNLIHSKAEHTGMCSASLVTDACFYSVWGSTHFQVLSLQVPFIKINNELFQVFDVQTYHKIEMLSIKLSLQILGIQSSKGVDIETLCNVDFTIA